MSNIRNRRHWQRKQSGLTANRKVASSIPGSSMSVEVSRSKTPHPNCSRRAGCRLAWLTLQSQTVLIMKLWEQKVLRLGGSRLVLLLCPTMAKYFIAASKYIPARSLFKWLLFKPRMGKGFAGQTSAQRPLFCWSLCFFFYIPNKCNNAFLQLSILSFNKEMHFFNAEPGTGWLHTGSVEHTKPKLVLT